MKYLVNGIEWESQTGASAQISRLSDRLVVRTDDGSSSALAVKSAGATYVSYRGRQFKIEKSVRGRAGAQTEAGGEARAPMPGQIIDVSVSEGDLVEVGTRLMVLEAMKMQQPITATATGRVTSVLVKVGAQVAEGERLIVVEVTED